MSFSGKVVLVTGASSGIGAATAELFAKEGARVVLVGRNQAKLGSVAQRCAAHGTPPLVLTADLADEQQTSTIVDKTVDHFGQLDVLVNNAGFLYPCSLLAGNMLEGFDANMKLNVRAVIQLTSLAIPHLIKTKGNIINVSSVSSMQAPQAPQITGYCISKATLDHFTRCAATELAASGIRVNTTVNPGPVRTDILENSGVPNGDAVWERFNEKTALGRIGDPVEIADLILFLASDKARSITGSSYVSDNGYLLKTK